jgi:hypothetical protein
MGEASSHAKEVQLSNPTGHQIYFPPKNSCTNSNLSQPWDLDVELKKSLEFLNDLGKRNETNLEISPKYYLHKVTEIWKQRKRKKCERKDAKN